MVEFVSSCLLRGNNSVERSDSQLSQKDFFSISKEEEKYTPKTEEGTDPVGG